MQVYVGLTPVKQIEINIEITLQYDFVCKLFNSLVVSSKCTRSSVHRYGW